MSTEHSHDDEHSPNPSQDEVSSKQPRHSLASVGGEPGMWTTWEDVPLVLKIVELAEVLRVCHVQRPTQRRKTARFRASEFGACCAAPGQSRGQSPTG